jgi:hypothetical protein
VAEFVYCPFGGKERSGVEGSKVEALTEDEDTGDEVSAATADAKGSVMATGARPYSINTPRLG